MTLLQLFKIRGNILLKVVLLFYMAAFLGAFWNHSSDLLRGGLFPYTQWNPLVPEWLNFYWTSLTIVDLAAVLLLLLNIEFGTLAYLAIIVSDVLINDTFVITNYGWPDLVNFFQLSQMTFMIFVLATFLPIRRKIKLLKKIGAPHE